MFIPHSQHIYGPPRPVTGIDLIYWYVRDIRTSYETILWASMACYGDLFTLPYVDDVRTSQETHLLSSTACYGDNFTFLYVGDIHTPQ
jgi:hypothetical protein